MKITKNVSIKIATLAAEIHDCGQYLKRNFSREDLTEKGEEFSGTDCRLQVQGGSWTLHTGSADYDQDHRGSWGCSSIPFACTWKEAREIARDLIDQVLEDIAMNAK
jgi:hypothetical protein